jgi:hypothetical protein
VSESEIQKSPKNTERRERGELRAVSHPSLTAAAVFTAAA